MKERLDKLLASTGRWSRREAKELIREGRVAVDGCPARSGEEKVDRASGTVTVDGAALTLQTHTYIMLHKPAGVLSATEDPRQKTVLDLLPGSSGGGKSSPWGGWTRILRACSC